MDQQVGSRGGGVAGFGDASTQFPFVVVGNKIDKVSYVRVLACLLVCLHSLTYPYMERTGTSAPAASMNATVRYLSIAFLYYLLVCTCSS